ncbi:MAG: dolichyl-phosphate beta-glucosyltransferase, partial [Candidatus Acidiferrum sp.]
VNDGSSDNTKEIVASFARQFPQVKLVENPGNRGKGYSVRHGMREAQGEYVLFSDADLSAPICEAAKLFTLLQEGFDVAIGSRWLDVKLQRQRQPLYRQLLGRVFNLALRSVLLLKQKDTQCGFKAFTRRGAAIIFQNQRIERWGFDPELLFLAKKFGLRVAEVPVEWAHSGGSKINPLKDGARMLWDMLKVRGHSMMGHYKLPLDATALPLAQVERKSSTAL